MAIPPPSPIKNSWNCNNNKQQIKTLAADLIIKSKKYYWPTERSCAECSLTGSRVKLELKNSRVDWLQSSLWWSSSGCFLPYILPFLTVTIRDFPRVLHDAHAYCEAFFLLNLYKNPMYLSLLIISPCSETCNIDWVYVYVVSSESIFLVNWREIQSAWTFYTCFLWCQITPFLRTWKPRCYALK